MSPSGHWFDPESAEQYIATIGSLQQHVGGMYENIIQKELQPINERLESVANLGRESTDETHRQIGEIIELMGRYKRTIASSLLEIEQEVKQIKVSMEKAMVTDIDLQKLEIEKNKLYLERWKLVLGIFAVFLTGLLFPVVLWWLGVVP